MGKANNIVYIKGFRRPKKTKNRKTLNMATHFSANQYENAFAANRLQNYEIAKKYNQHPSPRKGSTVIVGNDRGHLLPGVPRSNDSPWGSFKGTWEHSEKLIVSNEKWPSALKKSNQNDVVGSEITTQDVVNRPPTPTPNQGIGDRRKVIFKEDSY